MNSQITNTLRSEPAKPDSQQRVVGRLAAWPRRCIVTRTTDGCEYIAEFDDNQTAAIRHTVKYPDGREYSW